MPVPARASRGDDAEIRCCGSVTEAPPEGGSETFAGLVFRSGPRRNLRVYLAKERREGKSFSAGLAAADGAASRRPCGLPPAS